MTIFKTFFIKDLQRKVFFSKSKKNASKLLKMTQKAIDYFENY